MKLKISKLIKKINNSKLLKLIYNSKLYKTKFGKPIFIILLLLISASTIIPFINMNKSDLDKTNTTQNILNLKEEKAVETYNIKLEDLNDEIDILGQIIFYEKINISSKVTGRLEKLKIQEGQKVKKRQILAEVERLPLLLNLKQQKSELKIAQKSYELTKAKYQNALKSVEIKLKSINKAKVSVYDKKITYENMNRTLKNKQKLFEIGGISVSDLESIKAKHTSLKTEYLHAKSDLQIQMVGYRDQDIISEGYKVPKDKKKRLEIIKKINTKIERAELSASLAKIDQAKKSLESTNIMLRETYIRSPIDGIIASKNMEAGEMIKADSTIGVVIDISKVFVSFNISERDLINIKQNQKVNFSVDALDNKSFTGTIKRITPFLDAKTRTAEVKAEVNNTDKSLLPGMFARAKIMLGKRKDKIIVPISALIKKTGSDGEVFILKKKIIFKHKIKLGKEYKTSIEVTKGLLPGDIIISKGTSLVYAGLKVE